MKDSAKGKPGWRDRWQCGIRDSRLRSTLHGAAASKRNFMPRIARGTATRTALARLKLYRFACAGRGLPRSRVQNAGPPLRREAKVLLTQPAFISANVRSRFQSTLEMT